MSTRTFSTALLLLVAACSPNAGETPPPEDLIECALGGAATFARDCSVERTRADEGLVLTVRHPDGGFRRFVATDDGLGVAPADGAQEAEIALGGEGIEVTVGADRYRFPATIAGDERR